MAGEILKGVHDTVIVALHDTVNVAVHDTVIRFAAQAAATKIGAKDIIGWCVTVGSIVLASLVAIVGWYVTVSERKRVEDAAALLIIKEVLLDALWNIPLLIGQVVEVLAGGRTVSPRMLALMDAAREGFDEHWDKVYILSNRELRRDIVMWFRELRMGRILLERLTAGSGGGAGPAGNEEGGRALTIAFWEKHRRTGEALFEKMGFERPVTAGK
jgi:hypothetical protein